MLPTFVYNLNQGPVASPELLNKDVSEGNCRLAVQLYLYLQHALFLTEKEILNPQAYNETGEFIFKEEVFDFNKLHRGDVIYAQQIKNKAGEPINKNLDKFANKDGWITALHSAIYLGADSPQIWHSTSIESGSGYWDLEKFLNYYKPISAKRIVPKQTK